MLMILFNINNLFAHSKIALLFNISNYLYQVFLSNTHN